MGGYYWRPKWRLIWCAAPRVSVRFISNWPEVDSSNCAPTKLTHSSLFSLFLSLYLIVCVRRLEKAARPPSNAPSLCPSAAISSNFNEIHSLFFQVPPVGLGRHHSKWIIFKLKHEDCDVGRGIKWRRGAPLVNCLLRVKSWNSAGRLSVPPLCTTILSYRGRLVPLSIHKEHTRLAFFLKSFLSKLN